MKKYDFDEIRILSDQEKIEYFNNFKFSLKHFLYEIIQNFNIFSYVIVIPISIVVFYINKYRIKKIVRDNAMYLI